jgi:hypothetical protein
MKDQAHLFLCLKNGHYAISDRPDGANLPETGCLSGWRYIRTLDLDVNLPLPFPADPEPILRALKDDGYWLPAEAGQTHGTTQ